MIDESTKRLLEDHAARFNAAVRSGEWEPFVETFSDDGVLEFVDVPVGPFRGRDEIAAAYAAQPPDDELDVLEVTREDGGVVLERFAWRRGGTGTMRITLDGDRIARLVVGFD